MGSQRVRHDWVTNTFTWFMIRCFFFSYFNSNADSKELSINEVHLSRKKLVRKGDEETSLCSWTLRPHASPRSWTLLCVCESGCVCGSRLCGHECAVSLMSSCFALEKRHIMGEWDVCLPFLLSTPLPKNVQTTTQLHSSHTSNNHNHWESKKFGPYFQAYVDRARGNYHTVHRRSCIIFPLTPTVR